MNSGIKKKLLLFFTPRGENLSREVLNFIERVEADGGTVTAPSCVGTLDANFVMYPVARKADKLYSQRREVLPPDGGYPLSVDDFQVIRPSVADVIDKSGNTVQVAINVPRISYEEGVENCPVLITTDSAEDIINAGDATSFRSEGLVFYAHIKGLADGGSTRVVELSDASGDNKVIFGFANNAGNIILDVVKGGSNIWAELIAGQDQLDWNRIAIKVKENEYEFWANGVKIGENLALAGFAADTFTACNISKIASANPFRGLLQAVKVKEHTLVDMAHLTTTGDFMFPTEDMLLLVGTDGGGDYGFRINTYGQVSPTETVGGNIFSILNFNAASGNIRLSLDGNVQEGAIDNFDLFIEGQSEVVNMAWNGFTYQGTSQIMVDYVVANEGKILKLHTGNMKEASKEAEYQAVLDYAELSGYAMPSLDQQNLQNQLVIDLKASGVWDKLDVFYHTVNDAGFDFCRINWKEAGVSSLTGTAFTFKENIGITRPTTSANLSMNYNPSTAINWQLNDACFGWKSADVAPGVGTDDGILRSSLNGLDQGSTNAIWLYDSNYNCLVWVNKNGSGAKFSNTYRYITEGTYRHINVGSNVNKAFLNRDGIELTSVAHIPTGVIITAMNLFQGTFSASFQMIYMGGFLTEAEVLALDTAFNTSIGASI